MTNRRMYITELQCLTNEVICMGNAIEVMIAKVEQAIKDWDIDLAAEIVEGDELINTMEYKIEKECITLIAKQQPVAGDLRRVSSCMRLIADLERIGDHCADICEYIIEMKKTDEKIESESFFEMYDEMKSMVHKTIKAFAKGNMELARTVVVMDDVVDSIFLEEVEKVKIDIRKGKNVDFSVNYIMILKYVERMADHASNVAEWVHYLVSGNLQDSMHLEA